MKSRGGWKHLRARNRNRQGAPPSPLLGKGAGKERVGERVSHFDGLAPHLHAARAGPSGAVSAAPLLRHAAAGRDVVAREVHRRLPEAVGHLVGLRGGAGDGGLHRGARGKGGQRGAKGAEGEGWPVRKTGFESRGGPLERSDGRVAALRTGSTHGQRKEG